MICAWDSFLRLIPAWMRSDVDKLTKDSLLELRIRIQKKPELVTQKGSIWLYKHATGDDIKYCINCASEYSPWSASTVQDGYITGHGGHRIGICGESISSNSVMKGIREPTSICIRVARDFPGIAAAAERYSGSILIIGKPGSGKTTLLRDLIRNVSDNSAGSVAVVDEKQEIFPMFQNIYCFSTGKHTDILSGCRKSQGIQNVLRNMGPSTIAVDEITAEEDCEALVHAGWCGVRLLATAHAANVSDLNKRPVYRPIIESGLFDTILVLQSDKSWYAERLKI